MTRQPARPERLKSPDGAPPRLTALALPAYAYVPRREPHPVTHPEGHSYGIREEPIDLGSNRLPEDWGAVEEYLYGIDLFNAAYFWEAHESWEAVWHAVERDSTEGLFLQGMIQGSAAMLQRHCGRLRGAANLLERSARNLVPAHAWLADHGATAYMGVELESWQAGLGEWILDDGTDFPFLLVTAGTEAGRFRSD